MSWTNETPGARLVSDMQTDICRYVQMPEDTEVLEIAFEGLRDAAARINRYNWRFLLNFQEITFAAGTNEYELEEPFREPRHLALLDASGTEVERLPFMPWKTMVLDRPLDHNSVPFAYSCRNTFQDGVLTLSSKPGAAWVSRYPTGRLDYFANLLIPQTNEIYGAPQRFESFLIWHAKMATAASVAPSKVVFAAQMAESAFRELRKQNTTVTTDWE